MTLATPIIPLDSYIFIDNNKEQVDKYQCPKCENILRDAVQTSCGHWLCQGCAEEMFEKNPKPTCPRPECSEELTNEDGKPFFPDRFLRKEINRFPVNCVNRKHGCGWSGVLGELGNHLMTCTYEKKACPHCKEYLSLAEYTCHVDLCPKAITHCPFKDIGCSEKKEITKDVCDKHLSTPSGIVSHFSLIASYLSNLRTASPIKKAERSEVGSLTSISTCGPGNVPFVQDRPHEASRASNQPFIAMNPEMNSTTTTSDDDELQYRMFPMAPENCTIKNDKLVSSLISMRQDDTYLKKEEKDNAHKIMERNNELTAAGAGSSPHTSTTCGATAKPNFRMVHTDGGYNTDHDMQHMLNEMASANMPGLDKLTQSIATQVDQLRKRPSEKDSVIYTLQDKVQYLESTIQTKSSENEDRDFRLSLMENSNYDGTMVWKIPQFSQRMEDARTGKYTSIFSLPFYSSRYGYKMRLRLYILGDGIGKGTHMSLFFVLMKGEFDNILQWPFTHKVTFKLINQCGGRDIVDIFQPDPLSSSFQKPKSDMNIASGCPRFVSLNELMQGEFIVEDTVFIKVKVDVTTMKHP